MPPELSIQQANARVARDRAAADLMATEASIKKREARLKELRTTLNSEEDMGLLTEETLKNMKAEYNQLIASPGSL